MISQSHNHNKKKTKKLKGGDERFDSSSVNSPDVVIVRRSSVIGKIDDEAHSIFYFFTEPSSSKASFRLNAFLSVLSLIRVFEIAIESVDGPNHYSGRPDNSSYPFLMTAQHYWEIEIALMMPILVDTFARIGFFCILLSNSIHYPFLYGHLWQNSFRFSLIVSDILGVIPFFVRLVYLEPNNIDYAKYGLVLHLTTLLCTGRCLRALKNVPSIWAIRLALTHSLPHLVLPIFFFFVFNITTAVVFYFMEPCYNTDNCPWQSLFDSTFYSMVTMSTTGYGDQIPSLEIGRLLACLSMIFGVIYMSFPLAIIGNEYEAAWKSVLKHVELEEKKYEEQSAHKEWTALRGKMPLSAALTVKKLTDGDTTNEEEAKRDTVVLSLASRIMVDQKRNSVGNVSNEKLMLEEESSFIDATPVIVNENPPDLLKKSEKHSTAAYLQLHPCNESFLLIRDLLAKVNDMSVGMTNITPDILLSICELISLLSPLSLGVQNIVSSIRSDCGIEGREDNSSGIVSAPIQTQQPVVKKVDPDRKRLSISGGNLIAFAHEQEKQQEETKRRISQIQQFGHVVSDAELSRHQTQERQLSHIQQVGHLLSDEEVRSRASEEIRPSVDVAHDDKLLSSGVIPINGTYRPRSLNVRGGEGGVDNLMDGRKERKVSSLVDFVMKTKPKSSQVIYSKHLRWCQAHPDTLHSRVWMLLEQPESSYEARFVQIVLISLICLSILVLYSETLVSWSSYGEETLICEKVLHAYCADKSNSTLDPGCFVNDNKEDKLRYFCNDADCFGNNYNFGSEYTNLTCGHADPPFQFENALLKRYGLANVFTTGADMQLRNPICTRIECSSPEQIFNGNYFWIRAELVINIVFTVELLARIASSWTLLDYFWDPFNWLDLLSVFPFYLDVALSYFSPEGIASFSLAIIASSPEPMILISLRSFKIFRLFKLTRHFKASHVLYETAHRAWKQLAAIICFLLFVVTLFAMLLFEMEGGETCYVGDSDCAVPESVIDIVNDGVFIHLDKNGEISQFPNVFYGFWFSLVTLTTTGYGDIVPVTNVGLVMSIFLMLFGAIYMAMPLTVSATTFYMVHEMYQEKKKGDVETAKVAALGMQATLDGWLSDESESESDSEDDEFDKLSCQDDNGRVKKRNSVAALKSRRGTIRKNSDGSKTSVSKPSSAGKAPDDSKDSATMVKPPKADYYVDLIKALSSNNRDVHWNMAIDFVPRAEGYIEYWCVEFNIVATSFDKYHKALLAFLHELEQPTSSSELEVASDEESSDSGEDEFDSSPKKKGDNTLIKDDSFATWLDFSIQMKSNQMKRKQEMCESLSWPRYVLKLSLLGQYMYLVGKIEVVQNKFEVMLRHLERLFLLVRR